MLYQSELSHGGDIYKEPVRLDFSVNTNPYGVPESVKSAICRAAEQVEHYPDPFCRELTQAIASEEGISHQWILCGNGAAELIYSYCSALKPALAVETAPAFSEYSLAAERDGCKVLRYSLLKEKGFLPDEGLLEFIRQQRPDLVFLCNPNNPDGRNIPRPLLQKILALCDSLKIRIFLDECFLDFSKERISMKNALEPYPNLFILKAFTKNFGMAGVRLGYGMSSDTELLKKMAAEVQPWNVSVLAQAAGIAALKEKDFIEKARNLIDAQRPVMIRELSQLGLTVYPSDANYLLFEGPGQLDEKLRQRGIAIRNCRDYHGLGPGWYRISIRSSRENQILLDEIQAVLKE